MFPKYEDINLATLHYRYTILHCACSIFGGILWPMQFRYLLRDPNTINKWNKLVVSNTPNRPFKLKLSVCFTTSYIKVCVKRRPQQDQKKKHTIEQISTTPCRKELYKPAPPAPLRKLLQSARQWGGDPTRRARTSRTILISRKRTENI